MTDSGQAPTRTPLPLAFLPLHRSAFGAATGVVIGAGLVLLTIYQRLAQPASAPALHLLAQYFPGYSVSGPGAVVGGLWGFGLGFVLGWLAAFIRNFTLALSLWLFKAKAEIRQFTDFLDHIR